MVIANAVIDLRADVPTANDRFFVDTNVWRYLTYTNFTSAYAAQMQKKAKDYANYISKCVNAKATLYWSALSYSELAAAIERTELDLYNAKNPTTKASLKQFRLGTAERATVVAEVQVAWGQVASIGQSMETPIDIAAFADAVKLFEDYPLDGYDIFFVRAMRGNKVSCVITDDIDFTRVHDLRVFTANDTALAQARMFPKVAATR